MADEEPRQRRRVRGIAAVVVGVLVPPVVPMAASAASNGACVEESAPSRTDAEVAVAVGTEAFEIRFGSGRGERSDAIVVSARRPDGGALPDALGVAVLPLRRGTDREIQAIAGRASRLSSNSYRVGLCVKVKGQHQRCIDSGRKGAVGQEDCRWHDSSSPVGDITG